MDGDQACTGGEITSTWGSGGGGEGTDKVVSGWDACKGAHCSGKGESCPDRAAMVSGRGRLKVAMEGMPIQNSAGSVLAACGPWLAWCNL